MTPPSERIANVPATARDPDTDRLLHGRLHEPRLVLGAHERGDEVTIRVLRPDAQRIQLPDADVELARIPGTAVRVDVTGRCKLTACRRT
jgi:hypothetical protein